jgi:hypothetical protein
MNMRHRVQTKHARHLAAILITCCFGVIAPVSGIAQTPAGVVPITSEPDHKIRLDNGRVRMYEVVLPKGGATLVHEHRTDSFTVFIRPAELTNEPYGGKPAILQRTPGFVGFASTAKGPYSHRVIASGETTIHLIAMELLSPTPTGTATATQRPSSTFKVVLENPRGRAYRVALAPGESTETFTRVAGSALFAISAGRISESADGKPVRLWDFEPGHFRWFETSEKLSVKNESSTPIDLVEIEVF